MGIIHSAPLSIIQEDREYPQWADQGYHAQWWTKCLQTVRLGCIEFPQKWTAVFGLNHGDMRPGVDLRN